MIRKLIYKMRKRRFCKLNRWSCPDCICHDFVFEGAIFRGNKCRYPKYEERKERGMTREEAIQHFKEQLDIFGGEHAEAIKVAIEALEQVTGKLNNPDDSFLTADPEACKEQKSKLDLISRAEAYTRIAELSRDLLNDDCINLGNASEYLRIIRELPSADRPRGEWIHTPNGIDRDFVWWVCSECGHKIFSETEKDRIEFHAYCGRCGANMRSE